MGERRARRFPPKRLGLLAPERLKWIRPLWFLTLAFAIVLDIAGATYVLRDVYRHDFAFGRLGLASELENDGTVTFQTLPTFTGAPAIPPGSQLLFERGKVVPLDAAMWTMASRLTARDGEVVPLRFRQIDGRVVDYRVVASDRYIAAAQATAAIDRNVRMITRMAISLITCLTLIGCAVLLFVRRPHDPVALLFSFSFLMFASVIDPPLLLWLATGMGRVFDVYSATAWALLVLGIVSFPDGRFDPAPLRWLVVLIPLAAIPLAIEETGIVYSAVAGFVLPLLLLASHVIKYRRFERGTIERQQVKWAGFGFAIGLLLIAAALLTTAQVPDAGQTPPLLGLLILALFEFGFLAMAIGLLVSLLRFRLWEADSVISRSAISAGVTLLVGIVWTLSVDGLKLGVEWVLGEENATVTTIAGAVLAAGIFAPTQTLAMRWAKTRLEGDESRVKRLISRLAVWRTTETPEEIATRTLSALNAAVHCSSAAVLVDSARGPQLLASRDVEQADLLSNPSYDPATDQRFVRSLPLEDDDGPMGLLLIGPRSDFNRYNSAQLSGLTKLAEPLAETLRAALKRAHHAESVQMTLSAVEERLSRLEQGPTPGLA